ncbi:MAG: LD-carboxypeptidase [Deltaproteobacteria bacterium]|nr:LD-carboxypeptidase [Deltaproteobacteria bacterium]
MSSLPPPLRAGAAIRIVAPSGAFDRTVFDAGVRLIEAAGFKPVFDDGLFARQRYLAGSDARRRRELVAALEDPGAEAIWTARGGYGATRLLPALGLDWIRRRPKWLIGFSDATALHAVWARAGLASVHGANVTTLAQWTAAAQAELVALLCGGAVPALTGTTVHDGPTVRGPLLGGNLTVLAAMAGTDALPSFAGSVVLLEDIGERPYRLDRSLTQLVQAGAFAGVKGFAVGQLTDCVEPAGAPDVGCSALEVVVEVLAPLGVPIVAELPVGHESSARPVVLGRDVALVPSAATLERC